MKTERAFILGGVALLGAFIGLVVAIPTIGLVLPQHPKSGLLVASEFKANLLCGGCIVLGVAVAIGCWEFASKRLR